MEKPKGFKHSKIRHLLKVIAKKPALKRLTKVTNEIKDFTPMEMSQFLFYATCLCEGLE